MWIFWKKSCSESNKCKMCGVSFEKQKAFEHHIVYKVCQTSQDMKMVEVNMDKIFECDQCEKKLLWQRLSQPSYKVEAHIAHKKFWMYRLWFVLQIEIVPCETPKKETSWEWWLVFLFEAEGRLLIYENIYDKTKLYITR